MHYILVRLSMHSILKRGSGEVPIKNVDNYLSKRSGVLGLTHQNKISNVHDIRRHLQLILILVFSTAKFRKRFLE